VVGLAFLSVGCAGDWATDQRVGLVEARARADAIIRDTKAEMAALRAEMAATRIAAAKKEAEFQELKRQIPQLLQESAEARKAEAQLRQAKVEQQQALDAKQMELTALRSERDQLRQAKLELQTQAVQLPPLQQALADAKATEAAVQGRVKELEASVASLTGELEQMRQKLAVSQSKGSAKPGRPAAAKRSPPPAKSKATSDRAPSPAVEPASRLISAPARQSHTRHKVQPGDTLGALAQQYGVTVEALQIANKLQNDVIHVGQLLLIPADESPTLQLSP